MSTVTNSRGVEVHVYASLGEAVEAEVVAPIQAGLSADEDARVLFDVDGIAEAVLEWHTEHVERDGELVEWLPSAGYCNGLDGEPESFWTVVQAHAREVQA